MDEIAVGVVRRAGGVAAEAWGGGEVVVGVLVGEGRGGEEADAVGGAGAADVVDDKRPGCRRLASTL